MESLKQKKEDILRQIHNLQEKQVSLHPEKEDHKNRLLMIEYFEKDKIYDALKLRYDELCLKMQDKCVRKVFHNQIHKKEMDFEIERFRRNNELRRKLNKDLYSFTSRHN